MMLLLLFFFLRGEGGGQKVSKQKFSQNLVNAQKISPPK